MISLIVVCAPWGEMTKTGKSEIADKEILDYYKKLVNGRTVIMDSKCMEDWYNDYMVSDFPNQRRIVSQTYDNRCNPRSGFEAMNFNDIVKQFKWTDEEVFVIGGGELILSFYEHCFKIYKYEVETTVWGAHVSLPRLDVAGCDAEWKMNYAEERENMERRMASHDFNGFKEHNTYYRYSVQKWYELSCKSTEELTDSEKTMLHMQQKLQDEVRAGER
jgi:dihydrofolate reductase